jgi:rubrerythrin
MKRRNAVKDTLLTTQLNDLLQLDVDAVQAYALTIRQLESRIRKQTVRRYQADHRRHIAELRRLIQAHDGTPIPVSHIPTGPFKLAMQAIGSFGDDKAVLLAFKTNERQGRDKYRRAATGRGLPRDVARVLRRAARDEERHYRWADKELQKLHAGRRTTAGRVAAGAVVNARTIDVIEEAEKPIMAVVEATRRGVRAAARHPLRTAGVAAAIAGAAGAAVALRRRG